MIPTHTPNTNPLEGAGPAVVCSLELPAREPPEWIQVVPAHPFHHPLVGTVPINQAFLDQLAANFGRQNDLVVDWEHQSLADPPIPAPAAGWVDRVEVRDTGLWCHVREWTPNAEIQIRRGEYRYLSPVLYLQAKDRQTGRYVGPWLDSVGLTNRPQILGMQPLVNRGVVPSQIGSLSSPEEGVGTMPPNTSSPPPVSSMLRLLSLLKLPADATEDQAVAALEAERLAIPDSLRTELALPVGSDLAVACSLVKSLKSLEKEKGVPLGDHAQVVGELAQVRAELRVLTDGVAPAARSIACRLWLSDETVYAEWLKTAPRVPEGVLVPPPPRGAAGGPVDPAAALAPMERAVCRTMGVSPQEFIAAQGV